MLTRFYADNFLCLVNFELALDETNVFLGPNGSGKTSVLRALRCIQSLVSRGSRVEEVLPTRDLSLLQDRDQQRFELDLTIDGSDYRYALNIKHNRANRRMWIEDETLIHDEKPLFEAKQGALQLYSDDYSSDLGGLWDSSRSGIGAVHERSDNRKLIRFRQAIANFIVASPCPPLFEPEARSEDNTLDPLMRNFVGWYRHAAQENMRGNTELFQALGETMPGFDSIALIESGENARALKADFRHPENGRRPVRYGFDQLSDGQKALVALYGLLVLSGNRRASLFLDEPDNYLSPREVQPWLAALEERCGDTLEQAVVVSHHPVTIDYMAGAGGRWFYRDGDGPSRVSDQPERTVDGISLSELVARGWER